VQLPVTIIVAKFGQNRISGDATVDLAWHPKATSRKLRAACGLQYDGIISGYASADIHGTNAVLPMSSGQGTLRGILWDDQSRLILAATGDTGFINKVSVDMRILDPEPRVFTLTDSIGKRAQARVGLSQSNTLVVGPVTDERVEDWTRKRIYRDEATRLAAERQFVQYKPEAGKAGEHERALEDLRKLINRHGEHGAWLWDPYLGADDVLRTLFYCSHSNAPLRALTAGSAVPVARPQRSTNNLCADRFRAWVRVCLSRLKPPPPPPSFADDQRAAFEAAKSNLRGLHLEFRMKTGQAGWPFHDRFLIFPKTKEGALAWSLGTSVNSMGRFHHILQQVDNGQLVVDAFEELWSELDQSEHLIWKTP
jgi:hypothetical protein